MKDLKQQIKTDLLHSIDLSEYGLKDTLENSAEVLYNEVIKNNRSLRGSLADRFVEALQGLPNHISIIFQYSDIKYFMYAIGHEDRSTAIETYERLCGEIMADACKIILTPLPSQVDY